ncbi:MAG: sulfotransferase [Deltaproteobacteria bacterium]
MRKIIKICATIWEIAKLYPLSAYGGYKYRQLFEGIKIYSMFIGYPRSGHSLIGALLDAHPNMIFAHELHALKFIYAGYTKKQIYYLLIETSRINAKEGRKTKSYSYEVPNQWQGDFTKLQVIGDKKGGGSTSILRTKPKLLSGLQNTIGTDIKFIHIVRNPFDNISTISRKTKRLKSLADSIEYYFSLCETTMEIKKQLKEHELFELRHESFLENPKAHLKELCHFLGVGAPDDYLNDCSGIVYKSPHKSRHQVEWSQELIDIVEKRIDGFPFLSGYSYKD